MTTEDQGKLIALQWNARRTQPLPPNCEALNDLAYLVGNAIRAAVAEAEEWKRTMHTALAKAQDAIESRDRGRLCTINENLQPVIDAAMQWVQDVESRLPDGMKDCTIVLKRCDLGHAWLTATNWIDHGCPTCAEARARREERAQCCRDVCPRCEAGEPEENGFHTLPGRSRLKVDCCAAAIRARGEAR